MIGLTVVSETANSLVVGWTPVAGALGYEFRVDGRRVSNTWAASSGQIKFGKPDGGEHTYEVFALSAGDTGSLAHPAPAPPPVSRLKGMYTSTAAKSWPTIQAETGCNMAIAGADDTAALTALRATGSNAWAKAGFWQDFASGSFSLSDAQALAVAKNVAADWADVVVGWYVSDEPTNTAANRAAIAKRAALLKSAHPAETVIAYYDADSLAQWKGVVDAFALDIYPSKFDWNMGLITELAAAADQAALKYYGVVGAFSASGYATPTKAELQQMIQLWDETNQSGWLVYEWDGALPGNTDWLSVIKAAP